MECMTESTSPSSHRKAKQDHPRLGNSVIGRSIDRSFIDQSINLSSINQSPQGAPRRPQGASRGLEGLEGLAGAWRGLAGICRASRGVAGLRIYVTGARADLRSANGASVAAARRWALDACDGCTGGASRKRCERGDNEATNLRDCCTGGERTSKLCERGGNEATNLRDCCTGGERTSKRCERGDCEGTNLRDCCPPEGGWSVAGGGQFPRLSGKGLI